MSPQAVTALVYDPAVARRSSAFAEGKRAARLGIRAIAAWNVPEIARQAWLDGWTSAHRDQAIDADPPCKWCHGRGCIHCG